MGLSVTEKQELRSIISKRISARIDQLKSEQKATLTALAEQAQGMAYQQLGIEIEMQHLNTLNRRKTSLEQDINTVEGIIYERLKQHEHALYNNRMDRIKQINVAWDLIQGKRVEA